LRDMYAMKFTEDGANVLVAKSGAEALEVLKRESGINVVMLDMVMPGMTGLELLDEIAALHLEPRPRCIVLSNQSESQDVDTALEKGAVGYIVKAEMIPSDVVREVKRLIA
jgi:CheY-like chemotaxis protein